MDQTRLKRCESFFGVHFDFHARPETHPIGNHMRPDIFAKMLDAVKPDFMQCDSKGHQGYSTYPTKAGLQAPDMQVDILRMLRDLTAQRGIALYAHHSGVFDIACALAHPDWAVVKADGTVSKEHLSVFGPYCDEYLIPQLKELAVDYKLDGVWVDGECWGTELDYSEHARMAWKSETGRDDCPVKGDADFEDYKNFCRRGFFKYVKKYIDAVKAVNPDFQITSNWIYSGMVPEAPLMPVDFLSGDYAASDSYHSARFHARCLMHQDRPWDLMAWGQNAPGTWLTDDRSTKEAPQYCQEAAVVLSLGGAFQFFNHQYDGGCLVQEWAIPIWQETAEFCRARQEYCFQAKSIPQVAILYSDAANKAELNNLFGAGPASACVRGVLDLCSDSQIPTDVLLSHQATLERIKEFGLLLIPDGLALEPEIADAVNQYVLDGGSVLLCGPKAVERMQHKFPLSIGEIQNDKLVYVTHNGRMAAYQGIAADYTDMSGWEVIEEYHDGNYFESDAHPMLLGRTFGSGKVYALNFNLGRMYLNNKTTLIRKLMQSITDDLFPNRMVRVNGSMYADITLMRKGDSIMLNIVNSAGPHADSHVRSYSEIPQIGPLKVEMRLKDAPKQVICQPEGQMIDFSWEDGVLRFDVDHVPIHTIIEIKE